MEHPIATIAMPSRRKPERYDCGAFYNLYRVIGDCCNGVPSLDTGTKTEWAEMLIARIRLDVCARTEVKDKDYSYATIAEMCAEVDKFLKDFKL